MEIAEIRESLRRAMRNRIGSDLVPYGGQWVARSFLENKLRQERANARVHALELLILYVGSAFISLLMIGIFWYLCY
jgi:hypothetical protein